MKSVNKTISIIGCGWLGYPLAKKLILNGWGVKGSTTTDDKISKMEGDGIEAYIYQIPTDKEFESQLIDSEYLVFNIPPGRDDKSQSENYANSIKEILEQASVLNCLKKIIFISATSVYGSDQDVFNERSECNSKTTSGKLMLEAESLIINSGIPYVILRFGGLAGPERHPGKFLAGRTGLTTGNQSVNFLHLDDAIEIIDYFLEFQISNEIFNVVSPSHPNKKSFYVEMANSLKLIPPTFDHSATPFRREVSVNKLLNETDYKFIYPDPMSFKY